MEWVGFSLLGAALWVNWKYPGVRRLIVFNWKRAAVARKRARAKRRP